ncbi:arabinan endo-1,5-alpha-L-arabinosidase [Parabacteroides sp. PF5-5]|uniref:arabinan endo-1,5-alpha-L-arabinosidase n=1 Tax=unclassified Parabacteroides TaxID=2649774 RepID=UPI00247711A0|nr:MULTISPECIES: arabinan endo-1,5-alpha-L-arabinosidase [unclassified Parabacteroides]MDH6304314.1 arabinan endo-1,5-alpha-L-arabinosidase [Parabacteroides sp. PH5-39]MDH6315533.1 arabinan endo-1,5-alpha-L-arabinosidase [Parabacteroides sp. PF5-13]MDH6318973.1 arabinan endo-1,5-alpha-L-arabinosidase [Parabacteroides sp. PH5-13]MDH6322702.1 arabinan endo-1,5-alpha-L-arabinosidase [Parabacteroides sp. PH5-8]MDH6326726.1 arabinan endo-1,5-alpha-L-arabinosidase [Parabacteroides sp. PH5-41]
MDRKLLAASALSLCLLLACNPPAAFTPQPSTNPWQDDYSSLSGMENYKQWGTYNVHDPACKKFGEYYYMYSTDAIFKENKKAAEEKGVPMGYIQVRRSKDLVNWEFVGWAFPEIPQEAVQWVKEHADGRGAGNIWAPYIINHGDTYRLYYCVSAFGRKTSYIGLAESSSPEGPWELKGAVVKTNNESVMNAIDPSVIVDPDNGKWWMHYGSYFGGLFCLELNPETGLPMTAGDQGHLVARRANYKKDNLEAPEIIYNPELKQYYLFGSYDPLMTTYNIRVGRSNSPEGPFTDFFGQDLKDTTNNFPILTAPYQFENHPGWAGTAHNGALRTDDGRYFIFHQARLSPQNLMMVLHLREMFFTSEGWPIVSPERYAGTPERRFSEQDLPGEWEVIRVLEPPHERNLEAGQILWGEGELLEEEWNRSSRITLTADGKTNLNESWSFMTENQTLKMVLNGEDIDELLIFAGQDWENEKETILFTGLDKKGRSVWGKRVK